MQNKEYGKESIDVFYNYEKLDKQVSCQKKKIQTNTRTPTDRQMATNYFLCHIKLHSCILSNNVFPFPVQLICQMEVYWQ